jgi:hypothetical protein
MEYFSQVSRSPERGLNPGPSKYEAGVLSIWTQLSVFIVNGCKLKIIFTNKLVVYR